MPYTLKTGVFVDAENIKLNGGYAMRYDLLRRFSSRDNSTLLRLNTYLAYDSERGAHDPEYYKKAQAYHQTVRDFGWKIIVKHVRRYTDSEGNITTKANADLDLAVDAMMQSENLDQVLLVTGDGDFLQLVTALQNHGCRVELLAFRNISKALQRQVDTCYSGYLIPDLLPFPHEPRNEWGAVGSCVRGICTKWFPEKGFGFLRFIEQADENLWITDPRESDSPYQSVFCHANELAEDVNVDDLMKRDTILEFYLAESEQVEDGLTAQNVRLVHVPGKPQNNCLPAPIAEPKLAGLSA